MGIEPTLVAWEATVLPLNYTRDDAVILGTLGVLRQLPRRRSFSAIVVVRGRVGQDRPWGQVSQ